jgi:hypothetical protein
MMHVQKTIKLSVVVFDGIYYTNLKTPVMELPLMDAYRMFTIACQASTHVLS